MDVADGRGPAGAEATAMANNKHMSEEERNTIESMLKAGETFRAIGRALGRDPTTIKKEVAGHMQFAQMGCAGNTFNDCRGRFSCEQSRLCPDDAGCRRRRCKGCRLCRKMCGSYEKESCPKLSKPPFVCNGCDKWHKCTLERRVYRAGKAQREYRAVLAESRSGIDATPEDIGRMNGIVSPLLKRGQSLHAIHANRGGELMVSEKTLYNYVAAQLFDAKALDMPRLVRYRKRRTKAKPCKIDTGCAKGRTYADFLAYMGENPDAHVVEMDTVEGKKSGAVLLTLHFVEAKAMLAFRRAANDAKSVKDAIDSLYARLGAELFRKLFQVLLADRGSEFSDPKGIEFGPDGERRRRVFYCDPQRPDQKGALEKNHEHIRQIIPKGRPIDGFAQEDIDMMMNHVNSYCRKSINDRTPYEMLAFIYGEDAAKKLGLERVAPDDVNLTPSLLKKQPE
jgi:IS30 family transposase